MTLDGFLLTAHSQTTLSGIIAVLCFYRYGTRKQYVRLIGFVFLLSFVANLSALAFHVYGPKRFSNIPQSMYDIGNLCFISLVFYNALSKRYGTFFLITTVFFLGFSVLNFMFLQKEAINSHNKFLSSFIILCYCIFYFYRLMVELPSTHLQRMPMFWFTSAFLMYHAGTLFLFAFTSYLIHILKNDLIAYWSFHNILSIIQQLLMLIGIYYDLTGNRKGREVSSPG